MGIVRCANCVAPLRLDGGPVATCAYCGAQTRLDAPTAVAKAAVASGARLADAIAFVVSDTRSFPFLARDASLPIFRTETLSTSRDEQDTLHVNLVQGTTPLVSFEFPIQQRVPRGVAKIALTVRVSAAGAMSLTLSEQGVANVLDREGIHVMVQS